MKTTTKQISPEIGAEVLTSSTIDFVSRETADECLDLLARHGVVVYREAHITDADLVAFSHLLGDVVTAGGGNHPDHPEISPVTLDPAKSKLAGLRRGTVFWHADGLTAADRPERATLLTAREVADDGGDTEFANTYAAYEALSEQEKAELSELRVEHSILAAQLLVNPDPTPQEREKWERSSRREHPLVWRHDDGRLSLMLGATAGRVVGMAEQESRALLDRLLGWATQPRFALRHKWRVGDLVIWDNRGMLHRAIPYEPTSRRLMHRTTLF